MERCRGNFELELNALPSSGIDQLSGDTEAAASAKWAEPVADDDEAAAAAAAMGADMATNRGVCMRTDEEIESALDRRPMLSAHARRSRMRIEEPKQCLRSNKPGQRQAAVDQSD